jgi:hypothetical protein
MGSGTGEAELAVEEVEDRDVAEEAVRPGAIEPGQGDEELGEGQVLAAEEIGEDGGGAGGVEEVAVVHASTLSCVSRASGNARGRAQMRLRVKGANLTRRHLHGPATRFELLKGIPATPGDPRREIADGASRY